MAALLGFDGPMLHIAMNFEGLQPLQMTSPKLSLLQVHQSKPSLWNMNKKGHDHFLFVFRVYIGTNQILHSFSFLQKLHLKEFSFHLRNICVVQWERNKIKKMHLVPQNSLVSFLVIYIINHSWITCHTVKPTLFKEHCIHCISFLYNSII